MNTITIGFAAVSGAVAYAIIRDVIVPGLYLLGVALL